MNCKRRTRLNPRGFNPDFAVIGIVNFSNAKSGVKEARLGEKLHTRRMRRTAAARAGPRMFGGVGDLPGRPGPLTLR